MKLLPTPLNYELVGAVENRILAENAYIRGRTAFWRLLGWGCIALGLGAALGLIFYGYSIIVRNTTTAAALTAAISKALAETELHTEASGTVDVSPRQLQLAPGQTVTLDPSSRIRIDPLAKITVDGEVKIQLPAIAPQTSSLPKATAKNLIASNFTVFKSVPFQKGDVVTGWMFLTSAQKEPTRQYCYYSEDSEASELSLRIDIATDEKPEALKASPAFDQATALTKCVWFKRSG